MSQASVSQAPARAPVVRTCASCEVAIVGRPVLHHGLPFCCSGCVAGGPCICSYDRDGDADGEAPVITNVRYCLDVRDLMAAPTTPGRSSRRGRTGMLAQE